jgi:hypothetical protein
MQVTALDHAAQRLAGAHEMRLTDELGERAWPHAIGERTVIIPERQPGL